MSSTSLPMGDEAKKRKTFVQQNPRHNQNGMVGGKPILNPRLFLLVACLWPLAILALFASSAPGTNTSNVETGVQAATTTTTEQQQQQHHIDKFEVRKLLDRVDVMGYGPTHPRVAFVVVGQTPEQIIKTTKCIFLNTDYNRIFVVVAVLDDASGGNESLMKKLHKIEKASVPHWHLKHNEEIETADETVDDKDNKEEDSHSPKLHVMFPHKRKGLAASRADAADFVQILVQTHEDAGVKSPDEDILLMLMQGGTKFADPHWLAEVTPALIVAPPLLGLRNHEVAMKLANAVSFHTEGQGKRTSFDAKLAPIVSEAPPTDINLSNGKNFRTPALNGAAIAMRLGTFLNLPESDHSLAMDPWSANLDLALNLWLCADGIDILEDVEAIPPKEGIYPKTYMELDQVAKVAAMWMDDLFRERFFQAYAEEVDASSDPENDDSEEITRIDWETAVTNSRRLKSSQPLYTRCRSFEWFIQEVNNDLAEVLETELREDHRFDPKEDDQEASEDSQDENDEPDENSGDNEEEEKEVEAHVAPPQINNENEAGKKKPSEPLRATNLEIVRKPKMVDITYKDVSGGHEEHPHMGALDADGKTGYIHDETFLKKNSPKLDFPELKEACANRDNNWKMMHKRVVVETEYEKTKNESGEKRDKIFCLVYTIEKFHDRIPNILETWGPKCDGFMVGSTKTDTSIGAVNIPHEGPEEYNNIWQKVRSMWSYIYDNYYDKYDWFHIGGDDLFLLVENLRYYLESEEIKTASNGGIYLPQGDETLQTPLLLGRRFAYQGDMNNIFDSGGSGYTMNKAALKLLVTEGFPNYFPHLKTFSEDTMVAKVLRKVDNVLPYDTKDDAGGERYMPFNPGHHWGYRLPANPKDDWYAMYSIDIKEGPEHSSPQSVAFHYIKGPMMKRLFALAYGLCPKELEN